MKKGIRPIAIHLPQFHPIPENDAWWGKGFTEWTNVTKARPLLKGQYQPHLPADIGFYDLRLIEVMEQQAALAKEYGIEGFMYYHYWFNGKQVLEFPVNNMIAQKRPDFPFMLCWANENWNRNWDGGFDKVLLQQDYSVEDDRLHMEYLCKNIFCDQRYIQIDGKPVFAIYRSELFPDISATATVWSEVCRQYGFNGIYLIKMESFFDRTSPRDIGFDAAMEFQPEWANLPKLVPVNFTEKILNKSAILTERCLYKFALLTENFLHTPAIFKENFLQSAIKKNPRYSNSIFEYSELVEKAINKKPVSYKRFPGITPMWDNTARRTMGAVIFKNSTPELYGKWLNHIVDHFTPFSENENFVFINAWNEWAEGNHLEPCQKWGKQYLEVTQKIIAGDGSTRSDS